MKAESVADSLPLAFLSSNKFPHKPNLKKVACPKVATDPFERLVLIHPLRKFIGMHHVTTQPPSCFKGNIGTMETKEIGYRLPGSKRPAKWHVPDRVEIVIAAV